MLTLRAVTGLYVGKMKIMLTKKVQVHAMILIGTLAFPRLHGPGTNFPKTSLQLDMLNSDNGYQKVETYKIGMQ